MGSTIQKLEEKGLIHPPKWLSSNMHMEVITGSVSYGVSSDTSDIDIYGFCIPKKTLIWPHLAGEIPGFGRQHERFEHYQQHGVIDSGAEKKYDFTIYSIVRYFQLCLENNPNMLDTLYVPLNCVIYISQIGALVRENRDIFLHKGCYHKFLGYSYSQLNKMSSLNREGKRVEIVEKYGFDVKFASHVVRLADECEQILSLGTIDLQRSKEYQKAIRRGDVSEKDIRNWFSEKEKTLERLYRESKLPHGPDEAKIKQLLLNCLETHFGTIGDAITVTGKAEQALLEVRQVLEKFNY